MRNIGKCVLRLASTLSMPMPQVFQRAGEEFTRFMVMARDYSGLQTTHMAWNMVVGVLHAYRKRLTIAQVISFSRALPPHVAAIFLTEWVPDIPKAVGTTEDWFEDVRAVRTAHNFSPPCAVAAVSQALWELLGEDGMAKALADQPKWASAFWAKSMVGKQSSPT